VNPLEAAVLAARSHGIRADEPDVPQFVEDARARIRARPDLEDACLAPPEMERAVAALPGYAREM
jgi:hypothetical protein